MDLFSPATSLNAGVSKSSEPSKQTAGKQFKSSCLYDSNYIEKSLPHYLTELAKNWHVDLIRGLS